MAKRKVLAYLLHTRIEQKSGVQSQTWSNRPPSSQHLTAIKIFFDYELDCLREQCCVARSANSLRSTVRVTKG